MRALLRLYPRSIFVSAVLCTSWLIRRVSIEIVYEHLGVLHHPLGGHHQPWFHVHHAVCRLVIVLPAVLISAVMAGALIPEFASNLGVNEQALVTIGTFREELAFVFWMHILTLSIRLIALGPVLTPHL